jgi:hypothetical protein
MRRVDEYTPSLTVASFAPNIRVTSAGDTTPPAAMTPAIACPVAYALIG